MVENTQSRLTFSPVTQIMKVQEGILSSRMEYVEERMQFSNTREKNSNKMIQYLKLQEWSLDF